jgi:hypothetical protein
MNRKPAIASTGMWLGVLTFIIGLYDQFAPFIPEQYRGLALAVVGLLIAINRFMTGTPIKGSPKAK